MEPPKVSILASGRTAKVSSEARHSNALTGKPEEPAGASGLRIFDKLIPDSSLPEINEPDPKLRSFGVSTGLDSGRLEQAAKVNIAKAEAIIPSGETEFLDRMVGALSAEL